MTDYLQAKEWHDIVQHATGHIRGVLDTIKASQKEK